MMKPKALAPPTPPPPPPPPPPRPGRLALFKSSLHWLSTPSAFLPHGLSGVLSLLIGSHLIYCSLTGNLGPYMLETNGSDNSITTTLHDTDDFNIPYEVLAYTISATMNALGGYQLLHTAPKDVRPLFQKCAVIQICLCYFVLRFLPHISHLLNNSCLVDSLVPRMVRVMDGCFTIVAVGCTLSFLEFAMDDSTTDAEAGNSTIQKQTNNPKQRINNNKNSNNKNPIIIKQAILFGTLSLLLPFSYPLHLTILGETPWWSCIQSQYPYQGPAMVGFIYIPTTVSFSSILFGATLFQRKIINAKELGVGIIFVIGGCLFSCVMAQEWYFPFVSTQRIYLPCYEGVNPLTSSVSSWEERIVQALDFSVHSRRVWKSLLGVDIEARITT